MTYCVGLRLDRGIVFASDTRTNAGFDNVATFSKMHVWERPGDRVLVLMTAGNLAFTQSVVSLLNEKVQSRARAPFARHLPRPCSRRRRIVGETVRELRRNEKEMIERRPGALQRVLHPRRPDRRRAAAALPDLPGRQFHRGDQGHLLFPDRRAQIRQADPRPRRQAGDAHGRRGKAHPDLLQFDAPLQPLGRHADRPPDLPQATS